MFLLGLVIGLIIGASLGLILMSLLVISDDEKQQSRKVKDDSQNI